MQTSLSIKFESEMISQNMGKTVSDLIADWSGGEIFSAQQILADNPELQGDHSVVLDLAYEEFCRRTENGEAVDPAEFANRFPGVETPLLDLIDVHQVLYENPSVLTDTGLPRWPEVGESHLDLQLLEQIGSGSFSQVYIARESGVGERRVVAKLCTNANHEASLLGRLQHPNIVPILSVKTDPQKNLSAICMPYMGRTTLANAIEYLHRSDQQPQVTSRDLITMLIEREHETAPVPGQESGFARRSQLQDALIDISIQLCRGLEFAHSRGVIHGDLKPSNILLTKQGTALLMDFNLSERRRPESQARGGTLAYMAPEQLSVLSLGHRLAQSVTCSEQTDVYSFGVLLLELFTGSHPYLAQPQKGAPAESARKLFEEQRTKPVSAGDLVPKVGASLAAIIARCLELDPRRRWSNVTELRTALEQTMSLKGRAVRWLRRERKRAILIGSGLCCFTVASLVYASLPYESEKLFDSAAVAMQQERMEDAIELLHKATDLEKQRLGASDPRTTDLLAEAHIAVGSRYLIETQYQQSLEHLRAARNLSPSSEPIRVELLRTCLQSAESALRENRSADAVAFFEEARKIDPDSGHILFRLSRLLLSEHRYAEALEAADKWVTLEPENARAVANRGYCYFRQAEGVGGLTPRLRAREDFRNSLELEGKVRSAAIWSNIGLIYTKLGNMLQAADPLQKSMSLSDTLSNSQERVTPYLLYVQSQFSLTIQNRSVNRKFNFDWLDDCLERAPESSELLIEAARWYAYASFNWNADEEMSNQYLEQCIRYCDQAYAIGVKREELERLEELQPKLHSHQYWQLLIGTTVPRNAPPEPRDNLLDPLL